MKAYHIHDKENSGEEAFHEIVFAETASKAKYASEAYSNGVPWTEISVTRKPEFDQCDRNTQRKRRPNKKKRSK